MSSIISNDYQPSLFVSGVPEHFTYDDICDRVDDRNWGRVKSVILLPVSKKVTYGPNVRSVIIHYKFWFRECEPELRDLSRGKYLRLFYNKTEYWKAVAYDPSRQKIKKPEPKKPYPKKSETVKPLQPAPVVSQHAPVVSQHAPVVSQHAHVVSQHAHSTQLEQQSENMKSIINVISSSDQSVDHDAMLALAKEIMMEASAIKEETVHQEVDTNQQLAEIQEYEKNQELAQIQEYEKNHNRCYLDCVDISSIPTPDYGDAILPPPRTNRGKRTAKKITIVVQPAQDTC